MTDNLITLLKDAINEKKKAVKEYNNHLDKNLSSKIEILENLRNDINEITKIEISKLNEIVDSFQIEQEEKENMKKELDIIKALLTLNQTEKTNYTLLPNQLTIISLFLDNLEIYIDEKNGEKQAIDPEYNHIVIITNKYKDLLYKIKNPNTNELITDIDTILQLFQDSNIAEEEKQAILLALIKYNQEVVKKKLKENHQKTNKATEKELSHLLSRYGYTWNKLDKKYQEKIKKYGTTKNIEEVLLTMQELGFPKLNENKEGLLLTAYLIATTKSSLEEITKIAQERGINITEVKDLVSAFIPNDYLFDGKYKIGRKEDFSKNITLLVEHGISITTMIDKGKDLLLITNSKLQQNLNWLECYGLYSGGIQEDALLDDFISALKSKNIPEIIDLWIENHSLGLQYIKNNLSILACHISNQAILFYKLYKAEKEKANDAFRLTVSNGVKKLSLRKEMTHNDIDYQGIHDKESALAVTLHQKPIFPKEKEYEMIAKKSVQNKISDDIFMKEEILNLNRFSTNEALLYDINGLKISKLKVLRIYDGLCKKGLGNTLESLLYAICYNKIITKEEYEKLVLDIKQATGWKEV